MKSKKVSAAEEDYAEEVYDKALEVARKILIALHHEPPTTAIGATMMACVVLHQMYVSAQDRDSFLETADGAWDFREDINLDLFGKTVTTIVN